MKSQKGITLVELLVTLSIMIVVLVPIVTVVSIFMKTHSEVINDNELQHEARFIIEYFTERVRDGASWDASTHRLSDEGYVHMWYDESGKRILMGEEGSYTFSENVVTFDVTEDITNPGKLEVHIILSKGLDTKYELTTTIYQRNKLIQY